MATFGLADRSNHRLNEDIERFIDEWDGTWVGQSVKNMYENDCSYEKICEVMDIDYAMYDESL